MGLLKRLTREILLVVRLLLSVSTKAPCLLNSHVDVETAQVRYTWELAIDGKMHTHLGGFTAFRKEDFVCCRFMSDRSEIYLGVGVRVSQP